MDSIDFTVIAIYTIVIAAISYFSYSGKFQNLFASAKSIPWWIAGLSYFIISSENVNMLAKMGIVIEEGYSGLWIFYSSVLSVGFISVIFAPLWSRLKFVTDNQFILLRFSGFGAKVLHIFRATYVGYFATSIFVSLYIIAMIKLFSTYLNIAYNSAFIAVGVIVFLVIFKNSFEVKIRTDLINSLLYLTAFVLGTLLVVNYFGGFNEIYSNLNTNHSESVRLFSNNGYSNTMTNIMVYFGIQWWSINIIDGSGARAQRFMNVKTGLDAFKTAVFPILLMSILFVFKSFVLDIGLLLANQSPELLPIVNGAKDFEGFYMSIFADTLPSGINALVFIAFFVGLISIFESLLNWGASFIIVDLYSTYINKSAGSKTKVIVSYITMILIVSTALLIAWFNTHLLGVQKFIFSMAAGVGPVFVLRWFWKRVNAWSQLSAMISSLLLTLSFDGLYRSNQFFKELIDSYLLSLNISYYPFKILTLTLLVSAIWIGVTFLTKADDEIHLAKFYKKLQMNFQVKNKLTVVWKWLFMIILPLVNILPFIFVWCFKFYSLYLGGLLLVVWIGLIYVIVLKMNKIYPNSEKPEANLD